MPIEIERKFLLANDTWRYGPDGRHICGIELRQGYLCRNKTGSTVRVRQAGERAFLTIKGEAKNTAITGMAGACNNTNEIGKPAQAKPAAQPNQVDAPGSFSRNEYEYEIPLADCRELLDKLAEKPLIEKTRYMVKYQGMTWEIDEFHGENTGLLMAELEMESEEQEFARPAWLGEEVTQDPRYINANLVSNPYCKW